MPVILPRVTVDVLPAEPPVSPVARRNLAQEPGAFVANPLVAAMLASGGEQALPIVLVDGKLRSSGTWLSRDELAAAAGVAPAPSSTASETPGGCC